MKETLVQKNLSKKITKFIKSWTSKAACLIFQQSIPMLEKYYKSFFNEATQLHHKNRVSPVLTFSVSCRVLFFFFLFTKQWTSQIRKKKRKKTCIEKELVCCHKSWQTRTCLSMAVSLQRTVVKEAGTLWADSWKGPHLQSKQTNSYLYGSLEKKNPILIVTQEDIYMLFVFFLIYFLNWI